MYHLNLERCVYGVACFDQFPEVRRRDERVFALKQMVYLSITCSEPYRFVQL